MAYRLFRFTRGPPRVSAKSIGPISSAKGNRRPLMEPRTDRARAPRIGNRSMVAVGRASGPHGVAAAAGREVVALRPARDVDQADHHRNLDQRTDHRGESGAAVD